MTVKHQSSLVLEGGGSRGVFTAGVLDYLMEKEVKFPYVVGVSAGSCNALDYVSWQPGRTRDCMIIEDKANSYIATKEASAGFPSESRSAPARCRGRKYYRPVLLNSGCRSYGASPVNSPYI